MSQVLFAIVAVLVALVMGLQFLVRYRARAMQGKPVPAIPGPIGIQLKSAKSALLYFMSPNCGACRTWTPKLKTLSLKNQNVFVIEARSRFVTGG